MTWVDWVILAVLAAATVGGLAQGFFRTVCSLAGSDLRTGAGGMELRSAWGRCSGRSCKVEAVANTIGFLLIALLVMGIANLVGGVIAKMVHWMGLGCLDGLAGAILGFVQGVLLVMICILVTVAFFPGQEWLAEARLPKMFFGALPPEHEHDSGRAGRSRAQRPEAAGTRIAGVDAPPRAAS